MKTTHFLEQVTAFHHAFKVPILEAPAIPAAGRCQLRVQLFEEELAELKAAIAENDLVEVADALCDLQYVLLGTALEFGLGEKFAALFGEVHRSNMSKACKTREEAEETVQWYQEQLSTDAYYKETDGVFIVYRTQDDKALKSVAYSAADLSPLL
ncbi:nucleoside triphosphate pyrophosphohydrolase family protein [Chitinophaga pendula]|uniref:nucleoside triphosphate pyrophosphohydrolase family protein n=1 Tax=Chitinophaga TaxID=79328 RepID=UPI000BB0865E|nr:MULTISPECIES: nucleoside triphosphate pyrophosphohydrolase family protein [Chitinophaga]ASZ13643.1 hypothetical protein CK934_23160 [Chitinophaga sp. MD30]UCJ08732.1 nucleoside triphosphate pyrophosphohydrolase family protein [Chitinophaga pendula]